MNYKLTPYSIHELGQRKNQEDSLFPVYSKSTRDDRLFILCDGMGGHEKGEVASATVCEVMSNTILSRWNPNEPLSDALLQQAIEDAYDALDAKDNGETKKMGTTMTFLCFHADGVTVAHIGDSRVYQLRPAKGANHPHIVFRTQDHSLVNDLIKIGEITEEEAKHHPQKNVITRAMQPCQERRAKATIAHLTDVREGDYFYMCSDGMLEETSDDNLLFIITNPKTSDKEKTEMLREVTKENKDNHTAHLIHINKVEGKVVPSAASRLSTPQGTWVTPEPEKTKKGKLYVVMTIVAVLIAIGAGVMYFMKPFSEKQDEGKEQVDSVKTQTDTLKHIVKPAKEAHAVPETKEEAQPDAENNENEASSAPAVPEKKQDTQAEHPQQPESKPSTTEQGTQQTPVSKYIPKKDKPAKTAQPQTVNLSNKK